jgi:hypothetical protein
MRRTGLALAVLLLAACASKPPTPDWQMSASGALDRYVNAFMTGNTRVEAVEFNQARAALTRTGDVALVARAELTRCALRVASLALEPCAGFEPLRADAPPAERAYADYLAGRLAPADAALLPAPHRPVAAGNVTGAGVRAITDPLTRLVAAGVLLQAGRASPEVVQVAVDTAAAQGWRRPLLAWLGVQLRRAEQAGAAEEASRLRRRIALVAGES